MSPLTVEQWRCGELTFTPERERSPEAQIGAVFLGPKGERLMRPGFWDGGQTWKIRFAPPTVGTWRYETGSNVMDRGLQAQRGALQCVPYRGTLPIYRHGFLQVQPGKRYLTYRDGTPFFWLADTHWLWESETWEEMFPTMVQKRLAQGFTVYQVELFQRWKGDLPDIEHFQKNIDPKWQYLAERGIIVATTHGLLDRPTTPAIAEREARMARYLCARYGAYPAAWLMFQECTGHYGQWFNTPAERTAFMEAVRKVGSAYARADSYHQPRTAHSDAPLQTSYRGERWLDFTLLQGGHDKTIDRAGYYDLYFDDKLVLPQIEGEANYEQLFDGAEPGSQKAITTDAMREKAYLALQSGCAGYTYGANGVWQAVREANNSELHKVYGRTLWRTGIDLPGGDQLRHLKAFYTALPWHTLQPRPACDGFAVWEGTVAARQQPAVAVSADQTLAVVYLPRGEPYRWTLQNLPPGTYQDRWFDPRTGRWQVARGPLTKPDSQDWLLVRLRQGKPVKAALPPFRWSALRRARAAEAARNVAPLATVTTSSTDLVNKVYAPQYAIDRKTNTGDWQHWSSEGSQPLPAWLELRWEKPVRIAALRLSFMHSYEVQDYALELDGKEIITVRGNDSDVRDHRFPQPLTAQTVRFVGKRGPSNQPNIIRVVELEVIRG